MNTPVLTPDMKPVLGKFYMVPCARMERDKREGLWSRHPAQDRHGWVPLLGPEHHDREHLSFKPMHIHIDARFLPDSVMRSGHYSRGQWTNEQNALALPLSTWSDGHGESPVRIERALRRKQCKREMPEFPCAMHSDKWATFERAHASCRLKPGNICPHRGINLTPFIKDDGTVICPGHGLRWDTKTGEALPYHAR